jgi:hypothetical protein
MGMGASPSMLSRSAAFVAQCGHASLTVSRTTPRLLTWHRYCTMQGPWYVLSTSLHHQQQHLLADACALWRGGGYSHRVS